MSFRSRKWWCLLLNTRTFSGHLLLLLPSATIPTEEAWNPFWGGKRGKKVLLASVTPPPLSLRLTALFFSLCDQGFLFSGKNLRTICPSSSQRQCPTKCGNGWPPLSPRPRLRPARPKKGRRSSLWPPLSGQASWSKKYTGGFRRIKI